MQNAEEVKYVQVQVYVYMYIYVYTHTILFGRSLGNIFANFHLSQH